MRSSAKKIAYSSALVCAALIISYLESLLPFVPIPGFKLGLANVVIMVTYFIFGLKCSAAVSVCRITISALLFGSPISFFLSFCGGGFTLIALALFDKLLRSRLGCVGLGVLCSAAHCVGQSLAASILYGVSILLTYMPWLLLLSAPTGILTGALLYTTLKKLKIPFPQFHTSQKERNYQ